MRNDKTRNEERNEEIIIKKSKKENFQEYDRSNWRR
jgi:hypothetical protein